MQKLRATSTTRPAGSLAKKAVEDALIRHAKRDAKHIHVEVCGGRLIVSGAVHSVTERDDVIGAAKSVAGDLRLEDCLWIEPHPS